MTPSTRSPGRSTPYTLFTVRRWLKRAERLWYGPVFLFLWLPLMIAAMIFDYIVFSHILPGVDDARAREARAMWTTHVFLVYRILIGILLIFLAVSAGRWLLDCLLARLALRPRALP